MAFLRIRKTNVSLERVPFYSPPDTSLFLDRDSSQSTAHNGNPQFVSDLSRNAEFRAVLPTDEQQMTATAQLPVKICNPLRSSLHGVFFSMLKSAPDFCFSCLCISIAPYGGRERNSPAARYISVVWGCGAVRHLHKNRKRRQ